MAKLHFWKNPEEKKESSIKVTALKEEHFKKGERQKGKSAAIDFEKIKKEIDDELNKGKIKSHEAQLKEQRVPIMHLIGQTKHRSEGKPREYIKTGIPGLDDLFTDGIPKNSTTLVAGGAGSGKTIMCLQIAAYHAKKGEKVLYMSFEESEERLTQHMEDFGWNPAELMQKKNLMLQRFNPFDITRSVDALLMKAKGELLIDVDPVILPSNFKPDIVIVDSLTAIASAFMVTFTVFLFTRSRI